MLIHQVIHKHLERSGLEQRSARGAEPSSARSPGYQIDWLLTLKVNVAVLELFQKMLIHQVIHKHWERSDVDQRPVYGAERHVPDPPVTLFLT